MHPDVHRRLRVVARLVLRSGLALASATAPAWAQEEAVVEQLAPVLAAEDARNFEPALFRNALVSPDSLVRRLAAMAAGRIGDLRATPLLVPLLSDPDSTVRVAAAFALGLVRDTAGAQPLMDRITGLPPLDAPTAQEAITALAKIGGPRVGAVLRGRPRGQHRPQQGGSPPVAGPDRARVVAARARCAGGACCCRFSRIPPPSFRWRARLHAGAGSAPRRRPAVSPSRCATPMPPCAPWRRAALTRDYADSAGLAPRQRRDAAGADRLRRDRPGANQCSALIGRASAIPPSCRGSRRCSVTPSRTSRCRRR